MFDLSSKPPVRGRSPLALAASGAAHIAVFGVVIAAAGAVSSKLPPVPLPDLTFVNVVPVAPLPMVTKSVLLLPKPAQASATDVVALVPSPVAAPILERPPVQPIAEVTSQPLTKIVSKPAPSVVVGAFATAAPTEAPSPVAKQLTATPFDLARAKAPALTREQSAVGAFDQSLSKDATSGSDRPRPNTVADAGFGDGSSAGPNPLKGAGGPAVRTAMGTGFDTAPSVAARPSEAQKVLSTGFDVTPAATVTKPSVGQERVSVPVEVLFKPAPVYTSEARSLKIEGDVTLEVDFSASGQVRVVRIVRGLGHGLDEAAASAAEHMQFKPARTESGPIDFRAVVHITFRLT